MTRGKYMGENQHEPVVEEVLQSVFSEVGQRDSAPRRALVEELSRLATSQEGFTAHELQQRLLESGATVGRATIFRAIRQACGQWGLGLHRLCGWNPALSSVRWTDSRYRHASPSHGLQRLPPHSGFSVLLSQGSTESNRGEGRFPYSRSFSHALWSLQPMPNLYSEKNSYQS